MEYEIQDQGEDVLFDDSTNPSLDPREERYARRKPTTGPNADPDSKRGLQKAELIPEEEAEHQLA